MRYNVTSARVVVESCAAVVIGVVWIILTSYLDLDAPISLYGYLTLSAIGFAFGCFGNSPVLLIGPATSIASVYWAVDCTVHGGPILGGLLVSGGLFLVMSGVVLIGAGLGRGVKRSWMKKKESCAA